MPTYDYECTKCGHRFEKFQGINDPPLKTCPECRGKVKRLVGTGGGLIFKGQGFYITDYRSKDYHQKAKADSESSGESSSGSGESAPAPGPSAAKKSTAGKGATGASKKGGRKSAG